MGVTSEVYPGVGGVLVIGAGEYRRDRTPWLQARRSGLGASETAAILGLNAWSTPYAIWQEKTSPSPAVEASIGEAAEWGSALEAVVAREFAKRHRELGKIAPTPGLLRHPEHPWMLATPDRLIVPRGKPGQAATALLEVKTTGDWMARHHWVDDAPPPHVEVQVQQQLAVTGMDHAYVVVLVGGQRMPSPVRIQRDERVISQIITYAGAWWARHVVGGEAPPLTLRDKPADIYPGDADLDPVTADADVVAAYGRFLDARRRKKEATEEEAAALHAVQCAMGDHTALMDADGALLATWKPTATKRLDTTRLRAEHPDLADQYTTTNTTRRFLPKLAA